MTHAGHTRNFDSTLRALAERGHEVIVAVDQIEKSTQPDLNGQLEALLREHPNLSWEQTPARAEDSWPEVGRFLRLGLDYVRYFRPEYNPNARVRERAKKRAPKPVQKLAGSRAGRVAANALLRLADRGVPVLPEITRFIAERKPDVVLVTPLVELGSPQVDYVRAARALGIPTALPVASWDNLTVKGGIYAFPDLITVWNEQQRREAIELHDVPPETVVVTGAVAYDHWFDWRPTTTREQFCRQVGLDPARPYVLYVGSSRFIARGEDRFMLEWAQALRAEPQLEGLQILVRPHPTNAVAREQFDDPEVIGAGLVVYPPEGANPQDDQRRGEYFDSIKHSALVVGINTSAMIEAAILGRSVHTVLAKDFRSTQLDTLHFRYLLVENGGFVESAKKLGDHALRLARALDRGDAETAEHNRPFLESFVRPYGFTEPATPRLVDELERLSEQVVAPSRLRAWSSAAARPLAYAARIATRRGLAKREQKSVRARAAEES